MSFAASASSSPTVVWGVAAPGALQDLGSRRRRVGPHHIIMHENEPTDDVFVIRRGWAYAYKLLQDGSRHVCFLAVSGDLVDQSILVGRRPQVTIETLTDAEIWPVKASQLRALAQSHPEIASIVSVSAARDRALLLEQVVNLGRRTALARTAHFLLEIRYRLKSLGTDGAHGFDLPASRQLVSDALGLTPVHLSRVLRQLKEADLLSWQGSRVTVLDEKALTEIAQFEPSYLELA